MIDANNVHIMDQLVLQNLDKICPCTRFQLMSVGLKPFMIDKLEDLGILVKEYNHIRNLNYYVVNNEFFNRTQ